MSRRLNVTVEKIFLRGTTSKDVEVPDPLALHPYGSSSNHDDFDHDCDYHH